MGLKKLFYVCYIIFMASILLIPVFRNIYSLLKYKMCFAKHDKQNIESFCENSTFVYESTFRLLLYLSPAILILAAIFIIHSILFTTYKHNILSCIVAFILNVLAIYKYILCLY